jgi:putative endonuclease
VRRTSHLICQHCSAHPQVKLRCSKASAGVFIVPNHAHKNKQQIGAFGEQAVTDYLIKHNIEVIERNWRVREGEIDIVALNGSGVFSFIEVKTRSSVAFGHPFEAINRDKAHRMQRLALAWLATHGCLGCEYQIDVAAVLIATDGTPSIEYRANLL